jgi:phosphoglycerate dehydrogenase-like enzyme
MARRRRIILTDQTHKILLHFDTDFVEDGRANFPEVEFISVPRTGEISAGVEGEALLTFAWGTENLAEVVKCGVRWIHTIGTGVDRFPLDAIGDCVLTCARGASAIPIAEWVLAMMLAFEKRLPESWVKKVPERWNIAELGGLHGKTLGLVGLGSIGEAVATRAQAFGMRVIACRRTAEPSALPGVEVVADLAALLPEADHLVIAAAATAQTRHLIDAKALALVKPGVHLVNIARGSIVDQDALEIALDDGRVACASLDVCEPEPLPEGHWLYRHPQVNLSPHISWSMPNSISMIRQTFYANLRRFLDGEELEAQVDRTRGY